MVSGGLLAVVLASSWGVSGELADEDLLLLRPNPVVQVFGDALRDYYLPDAEPEFSFPGLRPGPSASCPVIR